MVFNETALTFNEQSAVIGVSFIVSLLSCVILAALLFGALAHLSCGGLPHMACPEWDENPCCICCTYVAYKYCPRFCCSDWKRYMRKSVEQMRAELYEQEMVEMRELESREREKREEDQAKWKEEESKIK